MKTYVTKVEVVDNQIAVLFPPGLLENLNLVDGQFLFWTVDGEKILITKKVEEIKNVK